MPKATTHNAEQVIQAIKGTGGIKVAIARRLGVSRWTVDNYIERWVTVKDAYLEECEAITDMAETNLIQEIKDRNFQAIKFYLQTKGKDRGYVERVETRDITWKDDIVQALIDGRLKPEDVKLAYADSPDLVQEFFTKANVRSNAD